MPNTTPFRLFILLAILIVSLCTTFAEAQRIKLFRNNFRKSNRLPVVTAVSPTDAKPQLQQIAAEIKADFRKISASDVKRSQRLLLEAVNNLQHQLGKEFDREAANDWQTTLQLTELKNTLKKDTPDIAVVDAAQTALHSGKEGARWTVFDPLRKTLRQYQNLVRLLEKGDYEKQLTNVCDNLVKFIDTYTESKDPLYAGALSDVVAWLDDVSIVDARTGKLADLTRSAFSGINVRLQAGNDLVAAGFKRKIEEILEIDETILGTKVVGTGSINGGSSAELVVSPKKAAIKVVVDTEMESNTDGSHHPVTLKNHTTGTLHGEKQILISAEAIAATPAKTKAKLNSEVSDVKINAGPLVKMFARGQISDQKADSQAEASRRAERRMNNRIDDQINPNIAEINEKYQKIRTALNKTGLFPRIWNLSSTEKQIDWAVLFANNYQPSAPIAAPELKTSNGLVVQIHQSALNNMAATLLAGRFIDEEKSQKELIEFFGKTPKFLERKSEDAPAKVSFGAKAPIDVLFIDNKIRVVVRLKDIQVMNNTDQAYTISVEYKVATEKKDGRDVVVLEQTEAEAFPSGYKKDGDVRLSTVQTMIRSYLLRRLEVLPKRYESEALKLGGEWEGKGELVPQFASAEKGWLTLVWNWKEN